MFFWSVACMSYATHLCLGALRFNNPNECRCQPTRNVLPNMCVTNLGPCKFHWLVVLPDTWTESPVSVELDCSYWNSGRLCSHRLPGAPGIRRLQCALTWGEHGPPKHPITWVPALQSLGCTSCVCVGRALSIYLGRAWYQVLLLIAIKFMVSGQVGVS